MTTVIFSFVHTDKFYEYNLTLNGRYLNIFFQKDLHAQNSENFISTNFSLQTQ